MRFGLNGPGWVLPAAVLAVVVAGCSSGPAEPAAPRAAGASDDTPAAAFEDKFRLYMTLPDNDELAQILGATRAMRGHDYYELFVPEAGAQISNPGCTTMLTPGMNTTYVSTSYQFVAGRWASDSDAQGFDETRNSTFFAVSFPSVAEARAAVDAARSAWQTCSDVTMTQHESDGDVMTVMLGKPTDTERGVAVLNTIEGGEGWRCARALGSYSSVVADVNVCGDDATVEQATAVQEKIFQKIQT